ncbi:MAG: hypothetical protein ACE5EX_08475, partial [Phycisphaerae bacterium]
MGAQGLLQAGNAIFYHPLNDKTEIIQGETWSGSGAFVPGKIPTSGPLGISAITTGNLTELASQDFDAGNTDYEQSVRLSSTSHVIFYKNGSVLNARAVTWSGTDATFGAEVTISANNHVGRNYGAAAIDTTHAVVAYTLGSWNNQAVVLTVSGLDITLGAASAAFSESGNRLGLGLFAAMAKLDSTHVVYVRSDFWVRSGWATVLTISGTSVTGGADVQFDTTGDGDTPSTISTFGINRQIAVASTSATSFTVFWNSDVDDTCWAAVGTVSGTDITFGTRVEAMQWRSVANISMATVDSTHAIAFYNYGGSTDKPKVRLATVSGTTVTWGDEATINSGLAPQGNTGRSITALSSTLAVAAWHDFTPRKGASVAISISGTTLTVGAETRFDDSAFPDAALAFASVQKLTSTTFLVAWRQHTTASGNGRAVVGTVSGTDITYGSPVEFNATQSDRIAVAILSSTKFLVAYEKGTGGQAGRARVGTISGTDITYGAEVEFVASMESAVGWDRMAAVALDSTKAVVFYTNSIGNNRKGQGIVATVSGTDVTFGTASEYHTPAAAGGIVWDASADFIDSTHVVVSYETLTSTGADRRFAVIGTVSGSDITFGPNNVLGFTDNGNGTTSERTFGVLVALSSTSVLGFWPDRSQYNPTVGTVGAPPISSRVGTVSGTDITFGAVTRTGTHAEADGAKAMALDGSRVAMVAQGSVASGDAPNSGALMIGTVSGSSISFDYEANLFHAGDNGEWLSLAVLDGTHVGLAYQTASAATGSRLATIDGTGGGGTVGPADSFPTGARTMWSEKLTSGAFAVYYSSGNGTGPGRVKVMTLEQAANLSASGAYASAIGATRVVAAMWLQKPTFSGATVTVE